MKIISKDIILICVILLATMLFGACSSDADVSKKSDGYDSRYNPKELIREKGLLQDEQTEIKIPEKYKSFDMLNNLDDDYYYFGNNSDSKYWKWIALDRKTGEVIEYAPIDIKLDGKFTFGYRGDLYTSTMNWRSDLDCEFKILKLCKDGSIETCFEIDSVGYPSAMPYEEHVVIDYRTKTKGKLFDLNLITNEQTVVMEYDVKETADGHHYGTRVSGLEYSTDLPTGKGFCYAIDEIPENPTEPYNFTYKVYYYSFTDNKSSYLHSLTGEALDYIGGDENAFIPRLNIAGTKQEDTDGDPNTDTYIGEEFDDAMCIYVNKAGEYIRYIVPPPAESEVDISACTIMGSMVLGDGKYIGYGDGVFLFDTNTGKYDSIKYSIGGTEGYDAPALINYDITDDAGGNTYYKSAFYFTTKDAKGILTLHKITAAEHPDVNKIS